MKDRAVILEKGQTTLDDVEPTPAAAPMVTSSMPVEVLARRFLEETKTLKSDLIRVAQEILGDKWHDVRNMLSYTMLEYHRRLMLLNERYIGYSVHWVAVDPVTVIIPCFLLLVTDTHTWDENVLFMKTSIRYECNKISKVYNRMILGTDKTPLEEFVEDWDESLIFHRIRNLDLNGYKFIEKTQSMWTRLYFTLTSRVKELFTSDTFAKKQTRRLPPTESMPDAKYSIKETLHLLPSVVDA
jgi:hypothetical protein